MARRARIEVSQEHPPEEDIAAAYSAPSGAASTLAEAGEGASFAPRAVAYAQPSTAPDPQGDFADPDLPYWVALNRVKGIGPARFKLLVDAFGTAEAAWAASAAGWQEAGLDARTAASFDQQRRRIVPEAELERLRKLRVGAVRLPDPDYPRLLREIPLPPPVLYVRGQLRNEDELAVAIVGTRRATVYGRQATERFAAELAAQGVTIVSGLARVLY